MGQQGISFWNRFDTAGNGGGEERDTGHPSENRCILNSAPSQRFLQLDLTVDPLPTADLVLCRDCLVHLSYANIHGAIENVKRSGAKWILMTDFLQIETNTDIADGDWRPLNFTRPPFNFPIPHLTIVENCHEAGGAFDDKSLGLWRVADLP